MSYIIQWNSIYRIKNLRTTQFTENLFEIILNHMSYMFLVNSFTAVIHSFKLFDFIGNLYGNPHKNSVFDIYL